MNPKQIPLALALALAIGALASGCAQDAPPAETAGAAVAEQAPAAADAHAEAGEAHDADHAHDVSHALGMEVPVPDNHVPWQPDAPLIEGMSQVRAAVAGLEAAGPKDEAAVLARAGDVDAAIDYMFENCTLDPEPDVALHGVLARLMAGSQALQSNPADLAPAHDMAAAVENYERLFDDPNAATAP